MIDPHRDRVVAMQVAGYIGTAIDRHRDGDITAWQLADAIDLAGQGLRVLAADMRERECERAQGGNRG